MQESVYTKQVNRQYGRNNLSDRILNALTTAGKDINNLTRKDISTFDEFHIGGLSETRNLVSRIPKLDPGDKVLDIGSGLGGPARTLAAEYQCEVVGLDLTVEFCDAANMLSKLVGLSDKVTFQQGDAVDMPFDDNSFDVVWTQFTGMNIEDKHKLYEQAYRVLRPGGYLAFHEVMAGNSNDLILPVFWADTADVNFLRSPAYVCRLLSEIGYDEIVWADLTQYSIDWFENMLAKRAQPNQKPALGFQVFVGEETPMKAANVIQNLRNGHVRVAQAVFQSKP